MKIENRTIVTISVGPKNVTLYFVEGDTMILPSNEHFTQEVLEKAMPVINAGKHITLNMEDKTLDIFTQLEKKSKGLVKFFRVAKKALLGVDEPTEELVTKIALPMSGYDLNNEEETVVAIVEVPNEANEVSQEDLIAAAELHDEALQGKPADVEPESETAPKSFSPPPVAPKPTTKVITGAENLKNQIKHFSESSNPEGFTKFMQRLAAMPKERQHSVNELLHFMNKGDLPIADDGCIVAYKRLYKLSNGTLADAYTKKVTQRVGSHVFMAHYMVDPDRRNECSNGLHIGRRDYMRSFSGDTIIICKINPEDVIAVPRDYSGSKMRCAGYFIVAEISDTAFNLICSNKAMTNDNDTGVLLTNILRGNHTPIIEKVEIKGSKGTNITITKVNGEGKVPVSEPEVEAPNAPTEAPKTEPTPTKAADKAPAKKASKPKATKAIEDVKEIKAKADASQIAPKVIKDKLAKITPAKVDMTPEQKKAKKLWAKFKAGEMTKVALAKECKTSTRSLERWAEKFNF